MQHNRSKSRRNLITLIYLLPALSWITLLLWAAIPHLFFLYEGKAQDTLSLFELMGNTWEQAVNALSNSNSPFNQQLFSYITGGAVLLSWIFMILFGIFSLSCAACALYTFRQAPTSMKANRAKRFLHLVCPNRVCFVLFHLLPILPPLLPYLLTFCFEKYILIDGMKVFYYGPADWILATILMLLTVVSFLSSIPAQSLEHRDLFRLYKSKKD